MNPFTLRGEKVYLLPIDYENSFNIDFVISGKDFFRSSTLYAGEYNFNLDNSLVDRLRDPLYNNNNKLYFIFNNGSEEPEGIVGLSSIDWTQGRANLIVLMNPEKLKSKLCYEPLKILLNKAIKEWRIRRVTAVAYKDDSQTQTVLKSFGFTVEGTLLEYVEYKNECFDVNIMGLLKSNFHSVDY